MNRRKRQWLKASAMRDRLDPLIMASVKDIETKNGSFRRVLIFRKSKLKEMRAEYGDDMEIIVGDKD